MRYFITSCIAFVIGLLSAYLLLTLNLQGITDRMTADRLSSDIIRSLELAETIRQGDTNEAILTLEGEAGAALVGLATHHNDVFPTNAPLAFPGLKIARIYFRRYPVQLRSPELNDSFQRALKSVPNNSAKTP